MESGPTLVHKPPTELPSKEKNPSRDQNPPKEENLPKEANSPKENSPKEENPPKEEFYDDIYFDTEDEGNDEPADKRVPTNDELLYDPDLDNADERWLTRQITSMYIYYCFAICHWLVRPQILTRFRIASIKLVRNNAQGHPDSQESSRCAYRCRSNVSHVLHTRVLQLSTVSFSPLSSIDPSRFAH